MNLLKLFLLQFCLYTSLAHPHDPNLVELSILKEKKNPTICQQDCYVPTPLTDQNLLEYQSYTHLSFASYCEREIYEWDECPFCQSHDLKNTTDIEFFSTQKQSAFGYMGVSHDLKAVFIVFRGALAKMQWIRSFRHRLVPPMNQRSSKETKVHWGFRQSWIELKDSITNSFQQRIQSFPEYDCLLIGLSYGGALASLMALEILDGTFNFIDPTKVILATIGSPRVGNYAFAKQLNESKFKKMVRIVHSNDLIPHLFPIWRKHSAYVHYKGEVWLDKNRKKWLSCDDPTSNKTQESPYCSNSIPLSKYSIESHMKYTTWGQRVANIDRSNFCTTNTIRFLTVG